MYLDAYNLFKIKAKLHWHIYFHDPAAIFSSAILHHNQQDFHLNQLHDDRNYNIKFVTAIC